MRGRLGQILSDLEAIYDEISSGYYEEGSLQMAVECQSMINSIVWKLNVLNGGYCTKAQAFAARPRQGVWVVDMEIAGVQFYRCDRCDYRQSEKIIIARIAGRRWSTTP